MKNTKKETIEFSEEFLTEWNAYCMLKGYSKRQSCHAANLTFMNLDAEQRDKFMADAYKTVTQARTRLGKRGKETATGIIVKETIEYDEESLENWSDFCNAKGFIKRHAAVAARMSFMVLGADQREVLMSLVAGVGRKKASKV